MSTTLLVDPPPVATAPPPSRASWSGQLRLGSCCVPVKAYPTISSTTGVSLRNSTLAAGNTSSITSAAPNTAACRPTKSPRAIPTAPSSASR